MSGGLLLGADGLLLNGDSLVILGDGKCECCEEIPPDNCCGRVITNALVNISGGQACATGCYGGAVPALCGNDTIQITGYLGWRGTYSIPITGCAGRVDIPVNPILYERNFFWPLKIPEGQTVPCCQGEVVWSDFVIGRWASISFFGENQCSQFSVRVEVGIKLRRTLSDGSFEEPRDYSIWLARGTMPISANSGLVVDPLRDALGNPRACTNNLRCPARCLTDLPWDYVGTISAAISI